LRHHRAAYATSDALQCGPEIGGLWTMGNRCEDKEVEGKEEQMERKSHQGS